MSSAAQPEKATNTVHGLDVTAMTTDINFHTTGKVDVTVSVTGTGTDVSGFGLYGASNNSNPSKVAAEGDLLTGANASSATRPASLSGQGNWTVNQDYTIEVKYTVGTGSTARTATWYFTVPGASISAAGTGYSFATQTLRKRTS